MLQPGLPALVLAARILPGSPALARHPWRHAEETSSPSRVIFNHHVVIIICCFTPALLSHYSNVEFGTPAVRKPLLEPGVFN